jgi:hypothetical protein
MKLKLLSASLSLLLAGAPLLALAQDVPGHPRENEVNTRLEDQQKRTDAGVASGKINAHQAARDSARDAKVAREESRDEAKHNGHLTKAEQDKMNRQLNRNSADIHDQRDK